MDEHAADFETIDRRSLVGVAPVRALDATAVVTVPIGAGPSPMFARRSGEDWDVFRISFDRSTRLVRAYAAGAWTVDETQRYLAGLDTFVKASRSLLGKARVLLDRREVSVQSPDVAALLATANGKIFQAEDRIAIVVTTSVAKVGLRQRMPHAGSKAFLSIDAAETWLQAFERRR